MMNFNPLFLKVTDALTGTTAANQSNKMGIANVLFSDIIKVVTDETLQVDNTIEITKQVNPLLTNNGTVETAVLSIGNGLFASVNSEKINFIVEENSFDSEQLMNLIGDSEKYSEQEEFSANYNQVNSLIANLLNTIKPFVANEISSKPISELSSISGVDSGESLDFRKLIENISDEKEIGFTFILKDKTLNISFSPEQKTPLFNSNSEMNVVDDSKLAVSGMPVINSNSDKVKETETVQVTSQKDIKVKTENTEIVTDVKTAPVVENSVKKTNGKTEIITENLDKADLSPEILSNKSETTSVETKSNTNDKVKQNNNVDNTISSEVNFVNQNEKTNIVKKVSDSEIPKVETKKVNAETINKVDVKEVAELFESYEKNTGIKVEEVVLTEGQPKVTSENKAQEQNAKVIINAEPQVKATKTNIAGEVQQSEIITEKGNNVFDKQVVQKQNDVEIKSATGNNPLHVEDSVPTEMMDSNSDVVVQFGRDDVAIQEETFVPEEASKTVVYDKNIEIKEVVVEEKEKQNPFRSTFLGNVNRKSDSEGFEVYSKPVNKEESNLSASGLTTKVQANTPAAEDLNANIKYKVNIEFVSNESLNKQFLETNTVSELTHKAFPFESNLDALKNISYNNLNLSAKEDELFSQFNEITPAFFEDEIGPVIISGSKIKQILESADSKSDINKFVDISKVSESVDGKNLNVEKDIKPIVTTESGVVKEKVFEESSYSKVFSSTDDETKIIKDYKSVSNTPDIKADNVIKNVSTGKNEEVKEVKVSEPHTSKTMGKEKVVNEYAADEKPVTVNTLKEVKHNPVIVNEIVANEENQEPTILKVPLVEYKNTSAINNGIKSDKKVEKTENSLRLSSGNLKTVKIFSEKNEEAFEKVDTKERKPSVEKTKPEEFVQEKIAAVKEKTTDRIDKNYDEESTKILNTVEKVDNSNYTDKKEEKSVKEVKNSESFAVKENSSHGEASTQSGNSNDNSRDYAGVNNEIMHKSRNANTNDHVKSSFEKEMTFTRNDEVVEKNVKYNDVIKEVNSFLKEGESKSMMLRLSPEELGKVKITVEQKNNSVNAVIEVQSESVKTLIQTNMDNLKQSLNHENVQNFNLSVSIANPEQRGKGQFTSKKKNGYTIKEVEAEEQPQTGSVKKFGYNTYEYLA